MASGADAPPETPDLVAALAALAPTERAELLSIASAWPKLPAAVRSGLLAIVTTSTAPGGSR